MKILELFFGNGSFSRCALDHLEHMWREFHSAHVYESARRAALDDDFSDFKV